MRGPRDLSAADGHTPVTKYQWFVNIHMCIHLLCISIFSIRRVYLYQINHTIMVSMPGISSLGHLSPENSLEQIHIATVNVYVGHTGPEPAAFCSEPTVRLLNIFIIILFFTGGTATSGRPRLIPRTYSPRNHGRNVNPVWSMRFYPQAHSISSVAR